MTSTTLRLRRDLVALEAFTTPDVVGLLKRVFPSIKEEFGSFMARFSPNEQGLSLTGGQKVFLHDLGKHNYADVLALSAWTPEGLKVTYLEYAMVLDSAVAKASHLMDNVLVPYSAYLAQLVTNLDAKYSSENITLNYKAMAQDRDVMNAALGKCFVPGSSKAVATIGQVIKRNADWPAVFTTTDALVQTMNKIDRAALKKKIAECTDLLDRIAGKIKREEFEGVSPSVLQNLSDGAFQVASELEFYSVTYYKVLALTEAVNRTVKHFGEVFTH
ncbi:hypothetical protein D3C71_78170 [compost metagenome]